ncbi:MAG: hypothetical protein ACOY3Y_05480 [Acidobacteriota bacterium]
MRAVLAAVLFVFAATTAGAQIVWVGAEAGTTWEYEADTAPDKTFHYADTVSPSGFVGLKIGNDVALRLRYLDVPHDVVSGGEAWPGKVRAWTIGVDYFFPGIVGKAHYSAGVGSYRLDLEAAQPPEGIEDTTFGWYLAVGEWFRVGRRLQATMELTMDRSSLEGTPVTLGVWAGLAFGF